MKGKRGLSGILIVFILILLGIIVMFFYINSTKSNNDVIDCGVTSPDDEPDPGKKKGKFDKEKLYLGGGLGLQFGSYTVIDISPIIGYRFNEQFSGGVGITYLYYSDNRFDYQTSVYGGGPFLRYAFVENLFLHLEYQILNAEYYELGDYFRQDVHYMWVGGGFRQELGGSDVSNPSRQARPV